MPMLKEFYPLRPVWLFFLFILTATASYSQPDIGYMELIEPTDGLSQPIELVSAPGDPAGRLFIVQKTGQIRIWTGTALLPTPFLDISGLVEDNGEQGLLSMAFHPQYASNGYFYVYYSANNGNITVARYQVSGNPDIANPVATPAAPWVSIAKPFDNHNGGHLQFRVEGGVPYLYFATGDGGSGNDPFNNAQNPASLLGKMLRINVDAPSPTVESWGRGLRNPFRWSFDRSTGDIWIADVGQGTREEIDFLPAATINPNFGWPCREGDLP
ncbi:MAG: sugar dehydrogenase, partial [Sphingobacteriales bacterium]